MRHAPLIALLALGSTLACGGDNITEETGPPILYSVELTETPPLTSIGETVELELVGVGAASRFPLDNARAQWNSNDPYVATVDRGVVTAHGGGLVEITASYEGNTAKLELSVWISTMREGSVRVLYVIPADKEFRPVHSANISRAITFVQGWYRHQLDGATFDLYRAVPEPCHLPHPEEYYAHTETWERIVRDSQHCAPVQGGTDTFSWALYVDIEEACDDYQALGRGWDGLTLLPGYDLSLMETPNINWTFCDGVWFRTYGSVLGGFAHELAHTFLVPHPPGCDEGLPTCMGDSLMGWAWGDFPNTYFQDFAKEILHASAYIKPAK